MKIVYTVATYYPNKDGVQSVTQKQAEALAQLGHEIVVICGNKNGCCTEEIYNGVKILRVNAHNKFVLNLGDKAQFLFFLKAECSDADILITVCMQSFATNWVLNELGQLKCRKILYLHGIDSFDQLSIWKVGIPYYLCLKCRKVYWKSYYAIQWAKIKEYDAVIHIHENNSSLDYIKRKGYKNNFIVYNAVENTLFKQSAPKQLETYFINVSNYTKNKNQKKLLKYFYSANIPCGLVLIGSSDSNYYKSLLKYKKKLEHNYGIKNVKLLHHVERDKTVAYLKNATAIIMTSKAEQFPLTILEAMAAGKPFICSDVGIVRYLPGGIVYRDDSEAVHALRKLYDDKQYCIRLGQEGYSYAKEHLIMKRHIADIINVLHTVMWETKHV